MMTVHHEMQKAWESASQKYVREYDALLAKARSARLFPVEEAVLGGVVPGADVVHPMSGHGIDDVALIHLGARSVIGVDYSPTAAAAAQRRADELDVACRYVTATLPASGLDDNSADLVYTGKGALIWVEDLGAWLSEMRRLLRPRGHLFIYEAHPLAPLWSWEPGTVEVRGDRGYFARTHVNDSFPAGGAVEFQRTLAETIMGITGAGFELLHLEEHAEPFWRPDGVAAAAWNGQVPNAFSLLARRRG
jgi:ubiquinone/menaquinone biosynthesis C-methylase UbiE